MMKRVVIRCRQIHIGKEHIRATQDQRPIKWNEQTEEGTQAAGGKKGEKEGGKKGEKERGKNPRGKELLVKGRKGTT